MKDGPPAGQVGVHQVVGVDLDRDHLVDGDQKQLLAKPRPAEPHSCGPLEAAGPARAWFLGGEGGGVLGWRGGGNLGGSKVRERPPAGTL